jgi:glycosyltransferase involved in cell wall biosynthesis
MNLAIVNPTSGGLSGGYRKYLQRVVPLIEKHPNIHKIAVYVPQQMEGCFDSFTKNWLSWPNDDQKRGFAWLKKDVGQFSPDVIFIPTARYVNFGNIPTMLMVRNMEPLIVPFGGNPLPEAIRNIGRAYSAKKACFKAARIIAVSNHVKDFLVRRWTIKPGRIGVVYHGVDFPGVLSFPEMPSFLQSQGGCRFIFTAGSIRPARGLEDVIDAHGLLCKDMKDIKLIIGGSNDPGMESYKSELDRLIAKRGTSAYVIWAGSLSADEMDWCYRHCEAFVMTSRAEACPNIVLEAMSHGCISVSTQTSPMPEFFDDSAALYYPPKDFSTLSRQIQVALSMKQNEREAMSLAAKATASKFSWEICAKKTVDELQKAL